ncbi:MAG: ATPase [Candidatus Buchananbacteria bacterium]|nr:ATPase [Candidatus Buchananbacteria bacterium]
MAKKILIKKASGEKEIFSIIKLKKSMMSSGVASGVAKRVISQIRPKIKPGTTTAQIHRLAFDLLKSEDKSYAARYNLKKAIMRLGPDGFPFEKYFAALLEEQGYETKTNVIVRGKCISHEVDVIAEKYEKNIHAIIEAKFHSHGGGKTGSKDALYTYARFLDIKEAWNIKKNKGAKPREATLQSWLVTNTKVTGEVKIYCGCVGIKAIGWDYASEGDNLQELIENRGLYPITVLISLNHQQVRDLLHHNIVLCKQLINQDTLLSRLGFHGRQIQQLYQEINKLFGS